MGGIKTCGLERRLSYNELESSLRLGRDLEDLADADATGAIEDVAVGFKDDWPQLTIAIDFDGDTPQAVARLHGGLSSQAGTQVG